MYNELTLMLNFLLHIVTVQPVRVTSSLEIQSGANPFSYKKTLLFIRLPTIMNNKLCRRSEVKLQQLYIRIRKNVSSSIKLRWFHTIITV